MLNEVESIAKKLTRFFPAQIDYMTAKAENETLKAQAKARNKDLYQAAEAENEEKKVLKIFQQIEAKNKELGLYKSHDKLYETEEKLIKWFVQEMDAHAKATGRENEFKIVHDIMDKPIIKQLRYRRQILDMAMRYKPQVEFKP